MPISMLKQTAGSVATPSTGKVTVFVDSSTGLPYYKDETGSAFSLGTAFTGGNLTTAINWKQFSAVASAATTDLGAAVGNYGHVTGAATITSLGTAPQSGALRVVVFDGACTLTHNATSLILPGGANITTAAGDIACFVTDGSTTNWRCTGYQRANGQPLVGGGVTSVNGVSGSAITVGGEIIAEPVSALTNSSGTVAINCALGDYFTITLSANVTTTTFSNPPASGKAQTLMLEIKQDGTGSRTWTWPSSFKWAGGTAGVISTAANSVDVLAITTFDQGTTWRATLAKAFS
jgi:hypothetical protein